MNRTDLLNEVKEKLENKYPMELIRTINSEIERAKLEALARGDNVQLLGFGTFEVRQRGARVGRNPQSGEEIAISESRTVAFKPGSDMKNSLKKNGTNN